jgi:lipopolysaccharide biosynthesis glycosyltransferase
MKRLQVFLTSDEFFFPHLATAVKSLLENNKKASFDIHVIHPGISPLLWDKLEQIISSYPASFLHSRLIDDRFLEGLKVTFYLRVSSYYRLFIETLTDADKVLYLDSDLIVLGDITNLFEIDLTDQFVMAVKNPGFMRHASLNMKETSDYFNSGVLMINLEMWRKHNVSNRVIEFVHKNPKVILYTDQCGLNSIIDGAWKKMLPKFNLQSLFFGEESDRFLAAFEEKEMEDSLKNPVIVHFTGVFKPWNFGDKHPYRKVYWRFRNQTPFKSLVSDDFSLRRLVSFYLPKSIKFFFRRN